MNPALIIAAIQGVTKVVEALAPVAQQAMEVASSEDQELIKAALADLQSKVDVQHAETQALLRG